jgi:hypothetical protein
MRAAQNELAAERQAREEMEQYLAKQPAAAPAPGSPEAMSFADKLQIIGQAYDEGNIDSATAERLRAEAYEQRLAEEIETRVGAATEPLVSANRKAELERAVFEMGETFPDFHDLSHDAIAVMNNTTDYPVFRDPAFRDSKAGIQAAFGIAHSLKESRQAAENARVPETLNSGSRGRQSISAEETIKRMIGAGGSRVSDGIS